MLYPTSVGFISPTNGGINLGPGLPVDPALPAGKASLRQQRHRATATTARQSRQQHHVAVGPEVGGASGAAVLEFAVGDRGMKLANVSSSSSSGSKGSKGSKDGSRRRDGAEQPRAVGVIRRAPPPASTGGAAAAGRRRATYGSSLELRASARREGVSVEALMRSRAFVSRIKGLPKASWEAVLRELDRAEREEAAAVERSQKRRNLDPGGGAGRPRKARLAMAGESYAACLVYLAHSHRWREALGVLDHIRALGLTPDVKSVSSALNACGQAGQWQRCAVRCGAARCCALVRGGRCS